MKLNEKFFKEFRESFHRSLAHLESARKILSKAGYETIKVDKTEAIQQLIYDLTEACSKIHCMLLTMADPNQDIAVNARLRSSDLMEHKIAEDVAFTDFA